MKWVSARVRLRNRMADCVFGFSVPDDASDEAIHDQVFDMMIDCIQWSYEVEDDMENDSVSRLAAVMQSGREGHA